MLMALRPSTLLAGAIGLAGGEALIISRLPPVAIVLDAAICNAQRSKGSPSEATPFSFNRRRSAEMMPSTMMVTR